MSARLRTFSVSRRTRCASLRKRCRANSGLRSTKASTFERGAIYPIETFLQDEALVGAYAVAEDTEGNMRIRGAGGRMDLAEYIRIGQGRIVDFQGLDNVRLRYTRSSQRLLLENSFRNLLLSPNLPWNEKLDEIFGLIFYTRKPFVLWGIMSFIVTALALPFFSPFPTLYPAWLFIGIGVVFAEILNIQTITYYWERWGHGKGTALFVWHLLPLFAVYSAMIPDYAQGAVEGQQGYATFVRAPRTAGLQRWSFREIYDRNKFGMRVGTTLIILSILAIFK